MPKNYIEKLKDPRWQKKRLKIFNRDNFTCQNCFDAKSTLHIHHLRYEPKADPWEYWDKDLITLCENCHKDEKEFRSDSEQALLEILKEKRFFWGDINELFLAFSDLSRYEFRGIISKTIHVLFEHEDAFQSMIEIARKKSDYLDKKFKPKNGGDKE